MSSRALKLRESPTVMQPSSSDREAHAGNGLSLSLQPELVTRTPAPGAAATNPDSGEVRVPMTSTSGETSGGTSTRRSRVHSHSHSHSHGLSRGLHRSSSEPEIESHDTDLDSEPSSSLSELRCIFRWLQKSLPFLAILCSKLVAQHALGEYCMYADADVATLNISEPVSVSLYQVWQLELASLLHFCTWIKAFRLRSFFR